MGRHGENIRKRKDGRWEARYTVYGFQGERKVVKSVYGHTYEEVKRKRADIIDYAKNSSENTNKRLINEKNNSSNDILFETVAIEWLNMIKLNNDLKPSTIEKYSMVYHTHLSSILDKTRLDELTASLMVEKVSEHISINALAINTQKGIYCVLKQILKYASERYDIQLPSINKIIFNAYKKPVMTFTEIEQSRLLSTLYRQMDIYKVAVLLCMFAGLRIGELCTLKWSDIGTDSKMITIKRTVQRLYIENSKTALVETAPKSNYSIRDIPLPDSIMELMQSFQNNKEYIFGGDKPLEPRTMRNHYKKILEEANISYRTFHTLRHTYATNCIERGVDTKSLCEMLGHSDIKVTLNYYIHPSIDTKRKHMGRLYDFYEKICSQVKRNVS